MENPTVLNQNKASASLQPHPLISKLLQFALTCYFYIDLNSSSALNHFVLYNSVVQEHGYNCICHGGSMAEVLILSS
jgi:hypothetical protein